MVKLACFSLFILNFSLKCFSAKFPLDILGLTNIDLNLADYEEDNETRRRSVMGAFMHAWSGYKKYAWRSDELKPLSNTPNERFQNWGATIVDSLSTLWLMGYMDEFNEAVETVRMTNFTKTTGPVNFFETTIRYLGGLISAYDLSGNNVLLKQAVILADQLLVAFDSPTGMPYNYINFPGGAVDKKAPLDLAEIGTCQMEFTRLSQITKDPKYERKAMSVINFLDNIKKPRTGLYPIYLSPETGEFVTNTVTFGAGGDSFYEYLIKVYALTGKRDGKLKRMYLESIQGFRSLVRKRDDGLDYFIRIDENGRDDYVMDHLSLFMGGLLQYGDFILKTEDNTNLGLSITLTGYQFINITKTHLAPESVRIFNNGPIIPSYLLNYLRPELLESLFYSWRFTKNPIYRDFAWEIFKAFNKYSKTSSGFASYNDVTNTNLKSEQIDVMESFFFAETLKYLYLIFSDDSVLDLNKFVFNTEAHPLKIPSKYTNK